MSNRGQGGNDDESAAFARALEGALAQAEPPRIVPPPPAAALALVVINGRNLGRVLALSGAQPLTLGRAPTCSFVVDDEGVARLHLLITPSSEGWLMEDQRTSAGAFVNGTHCNRTVLKLNDKIQIGASTILAVRHVDQAGAPANANTELDPLTSFLHKRAFASQLKIVFAEAVAANRPLTLALANLDRFMRFNDEHGHIAGDNALRRVVDHIRRSLPPACVIGRYSGDGFAIFIGRTLDETRALLEPMRAAIGPMHPFMHGGGNFSLSMSIGLASIPNADIATPKDLVKCADEQLFNAKREGRDRMLPLA